MVSQVRQNHFVDKAVPGRIVVCSAPSTSICRCMSDPTGKVYLAPLVHKCLLGLGLGIPLPLIRSNNAPVLAATAVLALKSQSR